MNKFKHDILLRIVKSINIILVDCKMKLDT